ncbi:MAG: fumarate hydratase C-terminal domain-containing protein, partial [Dehalococcoidia bacterium]
MQQPQNREWHLQTPLTAEDIAKVSAGDLVYLTGPVFTARDGVYQRMLEEGHEPPLDLRGLTNVSFQSSPAGVETAPGQFEVSSLQATAGFRYARYMPDLLERFGVTAVVGT